MPPRKTTDQVDVANRKRKTAENTSTADTSRELSSSTRSQAKRQRTSASKGKDRAIEKDEWPHYFEELFKVRLSLVALLTLKTDVDDDRFSKQVIISFGENRLTDRTEKVSREPVEKVDHTLPLSLSLAHTPPRPLDLERVAELNRQQGRDDKDRVYEGFEARSRSALTTEPLDEENVLVLDFQDNSTGSKPTGTGLFSLPATLSPGATKKLIEKRNNAFVAAVNELLQAMPEGEDPATLVQAAAREHIPIDPNNKQSLDNVKIASQSGPKIIPDPEHRPSVETVTVELQMQDCPLIFHVATLFNPLSEDVAQALRDSRKISSFFSHQVAAIDALDQGKHVIVSTSTASGKSVIYQVPFLKSIEQDRSATAIFIYPTKALAQDQKKALEQLLCACPGLETIRVDTYDGDTPDEQRRAIRDTASVIFTNFDMLHFSILPQEERWRRFLKNLKLVAVDELHYYTGTFGRYIDLGSSHVNSDEMFQPRRPDPASFPANMRGSRHATITNAGLHMKKMFGVEDVEEVTADGAPSGEKEFIVWEPPLVDINDPSMGRRGALTEADRRRIEKEAFEGRLLGIVATNALELGVDIGVLDAVMMFGFPRGGVASFRQQAGRAGRRAKDSLAIFVGSEYPIDQHYVAHPEELFERPLDELNVDIESKELLEAHLQCAGQEMPLSTDDEKYFGPSFKEICESRLVKDNEGW
ncbi:hypothetical protein EIP86_008072 [Pleurotus ostreatoroseus]|nr:hypothetical protein EIP86_008072 [Pleurotus ostreatoroseus]